MRKAPDPEHGRQRPHVISMPVGKKEVSCPNERTRGDSGVEHGRKLRDQDRCVNATNADTDDGDRTEVEASQHEAFVPETTNTLVSESIGSDVKSEVNRMRENPA